MVLLLILGAIVSLVYGVYRAARRWGIWVLWHVAAAVSFLGASGVVAERLWGPKWSWNFAHHGKEYAVSALVQGLGCVALGIYSRARQRNAG
jgi:hypothetical protein